MKQASSVTSVQKKNVRDWTEGNIAGNLMSLAWPVMISMSLNFIGPFIDLIWVGRLGTASVAGVGVAALSIMVVNAGLTGLTTGMRALIGRFVGAKDNDTAVHAAVQSFVIGIVYAVIVAFIGVFFAEAIVRFFGVDADVVEQGAAYLRIQFIGVITMTMLLFNEGTMQSSGDTQIPMRISIIYRLAHVALCPFLVFGWWIFPHMGVTGAATSDVLTQGLGGIIGLWVLFSGRSRLHLNLKNWRFDLPIIWRMIKIGIPNGFMNIQQHFSNVLLTGFIAIFGTLAVAAHTMWGRIDSIGAVLTMGIGISAGVVGAQNLGASKPERATKSGWLAAGFAAAIMIVCSAAFLIWAEKVVGIFTKDPELIKLSALFLRISTASYVFLGINSIFRHFLTAVGDTLPAFLFELIPTWGILIPMVFFFTRYTDFGVNGIRWALVIRLILGGLIFVAYFWWGHWKNKKV